MQICVCVSMCSVVQSCLTLCDPMDCNPPGSSVHGIFHARIQDWVAIPFSRGFSQSRDWTRSPTLQVDSLPAQPQGKPKNTRVDNLSLLQHIFPTQESSWGLPHCRRILYQLSYLVSTFNNGLDNFLVNQINKSGWPLFKGERLKDARTFSSVQFSRSVVSSSLLPHESQHSRPIY